jgi:hypothetical protein
MGPPTEPREDPVHVAFIDFSAAIAVSHTFTPVTTSYPTFLSLLNALSGSVAHKLENLPHQYVQGQGFTLSDGGWWYRFAKSVSDGVGEVGVDSTSDEKGPWTLLDCLYGYEKMVGELCLGVKWNGADVEVQHVSALSSISFAFLSMLTSFAEFAEEERWSWNQQSTSDGNERPNFPASFAAIPPRSR